ncbi:Hypothetical predicted protein [Marmota monax]|uniref:Proto-oncogene DBL n=1 Tax=Marmota monax TaxID=9995 RepID=A0A5E4C9W9_MARMO|nr:proto-oncogene DBL [Marmota monax]VTJ78724.1 Hypothetical predicted protein [Marmota monax]
MAAAGSRPHLILPAPAVRHLPQAAASALWIPGLWRNPDGYTFMQIAQTVPLQVDMAMALQRVRIEEKYGKSYLCLLRAVFVAETELLLRVKDISHFLMQDIAFLSGGRGKDNAWIITFPENCNFRCIPEEVIAKVLTYLTSIARQNGSDSRFTIILDRRLDTWSSLKISLQKISASFPGNLHLVLVLRPTSFLQRTFTDIGFRFSQEDFMLKLPVVMLSSVSDLLAYIDDKQLTPELGGTLQYCHSEWIIFRNAIENFALTVKEMAQMLQSFGTELAETELPDDIPSIEEILAIRAERYHLLKLVTEVELLLNQQAELDDVTGNIAQVKQKIKKLENLDEKSQDLLTKARFVILHGHRLAANHHYALDLICQRCNELRYLSDILVNEIKAKRIQLSRTFKMHKLLQQARQCCDEGECLLANQEMDKFQSKEDAQKALQDIENFLEMALPFINYDAETLQYEFDVMLSPELKGYRAEMDNPEMFDLMPPVLRNKKDVLFGNMAEIYEFHNNIFMSSLENCSDAPERVGPCFLERKDDFQIYAKYCQNKPRSEIIWKKYSECAFFQECQRKLKHRLGLDSYLLKPVQRITKYQLLLKELLKYSKDCEGSTQLKEALDTMLDLLKSVNDSMHQIAINGYIGNLNELGKMIMHGGFSVWIGHKKGATKMKDFARFKPMQRHLFLYEKAVVFCKRRTESGEGSDRYPSYSFKHCLKMDEVGITEYVKGDNRKFEIWYGGKEEVYIIQAPNVDVKMSWLKEIRNILLKQQELMTVKKRKQQDPITEQERLSPQQSDEKQQGAFLSIQETESEQPSAMVAVSEAVVSVQAEANAGISEEPEEWSSNYFYSTYDDHEEEDRPLMRPVSEMALLF